MIVLGQALALTGLIFGRGEVLALDELFDAGIFLTFVGVLLIFIRVRQPKEKNHDSTLQQLTRPAR